MRTPRSGANKKTATGKKNAASPSVESLPSALEIVPGAANKKTPRSGPGSRGGRGGGRRSNSRASPTSAITDPPLAAPPEVDADLDANIEHKEIEESEAISSSFENPTSEELPSLELENINKESPILIKDTEMPVLPEVDEEEESTEKMEHEEEEKTTISDKQEPEQEEEILEKEDEEEPKEFPIQEETEEALEKEQEEEENNAFSKTEETLDKEHGEEENYAISDEQEPEEPLLKEGGEELAPVESQETENTDEGNEILGEEEQYQMLDLMKERTKKKEREIFVGGLDRDASEDDVRKAFEVIGAVEEVRLRKDAVTNKNKGFAFVKFFDKEHATKALSELTYPIINGKKCGIAPSEDNDTLFVGNICNTWTKDAIKQRLKDLGIEGIESINLVGDAQNEGLSRGFAFVEFSCHEYAMSASRRLQKPDAVLGHPEWTAKVAFAEPIREPDPAVMAQVKSVFIDGIPPSWDEDRVKEFFKDYGEIEGVVLARNMPTAKRMDFGFVNFTTHEAAAACVDTVNDKELDDGKTKIKVRTRLANPLPKTQAVKGGMRGGYRIGHTVTGSFSRFGRGFSRGRAPFARGSRGFQRGRGSQGGRGFPSYGHARGGRAPFFPGSHMDSSGYRSRGRQPFTPRGGRSAFRGHYGGVNEEFPPRSNNSRGRLRGFGRGRGRHFNARAESFPYEGSFRGPPLSVPVADTSYHYGPAGQGVKRAVPTGGMEEQGRVRARYEVANPAVAGVAYQDPGQASGTTYPQQYYAQNYANPAYPPPPQGGQSSAGGYYY